MIVFQAKQQDGVSQNTEKYKSKVITKIEDFSSNIAENSMSPLTNNIGILDQVTYILMLNIAEDLAQKKAPTFSKSTTEERNSGRNSLPINHGKVSFFRAQWMIYPNALLAKRIYTEYKTH